MLEFVILYHGTSSVYVDSILKDGLRPPDIKKIYEEVVSIIDISKYPKEIVDELQSYYEQRTLQDGVYVTLSREQAVGYAREIGRMGGEFLYLIASIIGEYDENDKNKVLQLFRWADPVVLTIEYPFQKLPEYFRDQVSRWVLRAQREGVDVDEYLQGISAVVILPYVEREYIVAFEVIKDGGISHDL